MPRRCRDADRAPRHREGRAGTAGAPVLPPVVAREEQEADAAVDREDAAAVLEADELVDAGSGRSSRRRRPRASRSRRPGPTGRRGRARPPVAGQAERALDEQLEQVPVAVALRMRRCRRPREAEQPSSLAARVAGARPRRRVAAHHVPRRVADAPRRSRRPASRRAVLAEEHLGELERPVEEPPVRRRGRAASASQRRRTLAGQR